MSISELILRDPRESGGKQSKNAIRMKIKLPLVRPENGRSGEGGEKGRLNVGQEERGESEDDEGSLHRGVCP